MATILIVDDVQTNRDVLVTLLGYYGHRLLEAADGCEALNQARAENPDLIIADVLMPTMDGFEFVRQLRMDSTISATPVVFYTAHYLEAEARQLAASCAVAHVIAKPCEPQEVLKVVGAALNLQLPMGVDADANGFNREHLRLITDKLADKAAELRKMNLRLAALIDLGQQLTLEREPAQLIAGYCAGARDIVGATFVGAWFFDTEGQTNNVCLSGIDKEVGTRVASSWRDQTIIGEVLRDRVTRQVSNPSGDPTLLGLPPDHPPLFTFLAVPVFTRERTHGWLGLWNKLGTEGFTPDDVHLAAMICAHLAVGYDNARLYEEVQQQAQALKAEVQVRKQAEDMVRSANVLLERRVDERTLDLATSNKSLVRSNAELEQYAYAASHDLQEPLRIVSIYSELLQKRYRGSFDAEGEQFLDYVQSGVGRMRLVINDLLSYSRVLTDAESEEFQCVDLQQVVEMAEANCQAGIEESGCVLRHTGMSKVRGNSGQLRQVFQNLIANSIRYRRDEPLIITVSSQEHDGECVCAVEDNAMGFRMDYADRIFGLFKRLHGHQTPGSGIGLSICKRVVEHHGGRIWATSIPGKGSTFYFTLPVWREPI